MIPNPNSNPIIPPSPRRHAHSAVPFEKIQIHQNFLTIKSIPSAIYPPFDLRETSEDKPFIRIVNKETDSSNDTTICLERPRMMIRKNSLVERREIVIPNNTNMPRVHTRVDSIEERPHKKLHTELSYIKVDHNRSFPTADVYEPSDNDLKFLFELNQKIFNGSENSSNTPKITEEIFESLIVAWENETAENDIISLDHALQVVESSSCLKNKFLMDEINPIRTELLSHIYNYWKDLRDQYKRPLLRKFLKATNKDFTNPNIAFLRRKENKFARRRSQRTSSPVDDFKRMKNLKKTIERSSLMLANLKYREMIKLEMHEIKNKFFEEQVKQLLGEDYKQFEDLYPKMPSITCSDTYKEDRKKMEEYGKKGEIIVRGVNSMRKDSFKADISIEAKRKLSSNMQPSTSSISSTASTTTTPHHTYKPMSLGLSKMTHALPKNIQGAFTLSIKKSSIDLKDLKTKLKQSLGGLYLKSQDESRVKVEFGSTGCCKIEEEFGNKENHSGNVQKKAIQESREELIIRVDLEENVQKVEGQKPSYQTTVRYSIHFSENAASPYSQTFTLESAKSQKQPSENSKSQLIPHNSKIKS